MSYHFRCPYCGLFYKPWKGRSFNKLIVLQHPVSAELLYLPCMWPATAADNWLMSQAEIYARQVHIGDNLNAFMAKKSCELAQPIEQAGTPAYFKEYKMSQKAVWECTLPRFPASTYERHLQGFRSDLWVANPKEPLVIFTDFERLIALLGGMLRGKQVFELTNA